MGGGHGGAGVRKPASTGLRQRSRAGADQAAAASPAASERRCRPGSAGAATGSHRSRSVLAPGPRGVRRPAGHEGVAARATQPAARDGGGGGPVRGGGGSSGSRGTLDRDGGHAGRGSGEAGRARVLGGGGGSGGLALELHGSGQVGGGAGRPRGSAGAGPRLDGGRHRPPEARPEGLDARRGALEERAPCAGRRSQRGGEAGVVGRVLRARSSVRASARGHARQHAAGEAPGRGALPPGHLAAGSDDVRRGGRHHAGEGDRSAGEGVRRVDGASGARPHRARSLRTDLSSAAHRDRRSSGGAPGGALGRSLGRGGGSPGVSAALADERRPRRLVHLAIEPEPARGPRLDVRSADAVLRAAQVRDVRGARGHPYGRHRRRAPRDVEGDLDPLAGRGDGRGADQDAGPRAGAGDRHLRFGPRGGGQPGEQCGARASCRHRRARALVADDRHPRRSFRPRGPAPLGGRSDRDPGGAEKSGRSGPGGELAPPRGGARRRGPTRPARGSTSSLERQSSVTLHRWRG
jgi:hypothetical protein